MSGNVFTDAILLRGPNLYLKCHLLNDRMKRIANLIY